MRSAGSEIGDTVPHARDCATRTGPNAGAAPGAVSIGPIDFQNWGEFRRKNALSRHTAQVIPPIPHRAASPVPGLSALPALAYPAGSHICGESEGRARGFALEPINAASNLTYLRTCDTSSLAMVFNAGSPRTLTALSFTSNASQKATSSSERPSCSPHV
jgi:hypothetical protein